MIDPITLEVVRHGVFSIAEEMRGIVMRSARSPVQLRRARTIMNSSPLNSRKGTIALRIFPAVEGARAWAIHGNPKLANRKLETAPV